MATRGRKTKKKAPSMEFTLAQMEHLLELALRVDRSSRELFEAVQACARRSREALEAQRRTPVVSFESAVRALLGPELSRGVVFPPEPPAVG